MQGVEGDRMSPIENAIKEDPLFIERQRTIMIKKHNFTELINMEGISDSVVDDTIREIIKTIEYSPVKYLTLLEENKELKRKIGDNTLDYIISLKREIKGLKEDNIGEPSFPCTPSYLGKGLKGAACPLRGQRGEDVSCISINNNKKWEYFFHFFIIILINLSISLKTEDEK